MSTDQVPLLKLSMKNFADLFPSKNNTFKVSENCRKSIQQVKTLIEKCVVNLAKAKAQGPKPWPSPSTFPSA